MACKILDPTPGDFDIVGLGWDPSVGFCFGAPGLMMLMVELGTAELGDLPEVLPDQKPVGR